MGTWYLQKCRRSLTEMFAVTSELPKRILYWCCCGLWTVLVCYMNSNGRLLLLCNSKETLLYVKHILFNFYIPLLIPLEMTSPCPAVFKRNTSAAIQYARHNQREKWARIQKKQMRVALQTGNKEEKRREKRENFRETQRTQSDRRAVSCVARGVKNSGNSSVAMELGDEGVTESLFWILHRRMGFFCLE